MIQTVQESDCFFTKQQIQQIISFLGTSNTYTNDTA